MAYMGQLLDAVEETRTFPRMLHIYVTDRGHGDLSETFATTVAREKDRVFGDLVDCVTEINQEMQREREG